MTWDSTGIYDLLTDCKTLTVMLAWSICRRLDLAQPIDGYLDDLYLLCNTTFAIEEGSSDMVDVDLDYLYSIYSKLYRKHNRYKGLSIPAHHDNH
jgi:hypothetical protein